MEEIDVPMVQAVVRKGPAALVCHGLGSCLAIMLYDPNKGVGGLAHVLLPNENFSTTKSNPKKFADSAIDWLIGEMRKLGGNKRAFKAKIVGGATMFGSIKNPIGESNITYAREKLAGEGIELVAEDVGGDKGRWVRFEVDTGIVIVKKVKQVGFKYVWEELAL